MVTAKMMRAVKRMKAEKGKLGSSEIIIDKLKRRDVGSPVAWQPERVSPKS
jgi:hypothetical protein